MPARVARLVAGLAAGSRQPSTDGKEYAFDLEVKDASGKLAWQATGLNL